jgi:hypothetical protein
MAWTLLNTDLGIPESIRVQLWPYPGPLGNAGHLRSDVDPVSATVSGHLDQTIVATGPYDPFFRGRFRNVIQNRAVVRLEVVGADSPGVLLMALHISGQVRADDRVTLPHVGGHVDTLASDVHLVVVMRRNLYWERPMEALLDVFGRPSNSGLGPYLHVANLHVLEVDDVQSTVIAA